MVVKDCLVVVDGYKKRIIKENINNFNSSNNSQEDQLQRSNKKLIDAHRIALETGCFY